MSSPKVSVIMPIYNGGEYLRRAIDCVLSQTLPDFELVCVDDCSTDASRDVIKGYAEKDKRVKYIFHEKNMLTSQSRKDGALFSTGQYVMFLDQDDYLSLNALEVACKAIEEKGTDLVQFGTIVENYGDLPDERIAFQNKYLQFRKEEIIRGNLINACFVERSKRKLYWNCWNKIYGGDLCRKAFGALEDGIVTFEEDVYSTFLTLFYAESAAIIKDNLYHYCVGNGFLGHTKISVKSYTRYCKGALVLNSITRFVEKQPMSKQKELAPNMAFIKKVFVNYVLDAAKRQLPDELRNEGLRVLCSYMSPDIGSFLITHLEDKIEKYEGRLKGALPPYSIISCARVDVKNEGSAANNVEIIEISDAEAKITEPEWICKNGHGHVIVSNKGVLDIKLKCEGKGKMLITLRGMPVKAEEGGKLPVWIDYTKFEADGKAIFDGPKAVCHDKAYRLKLEAEDSKTVTLHIEWLANCASLGKGKEQSQKMQEDALKEAQAAAVQERKNADALNKRLKAMDEANKSLERELSDIRSGMSFKIGRIITCIPRKILGRK